MKLLLITILACYVLVLASFIAYPIAHISLLPAKWSQFLLVAFGILAGKGIRDLSEKVQRRFVNQFYVYALLLLITPSPLLWNVFTDQNLQVASADAQLIAQTNSMITSSEAALENKTLTVLANAPVAFAIPTLCQWQLYLAPNIHYSNPLAPFGDHAGRVRGLTNVSSPDDMEQSIRSMGVDVLIMNKDGDFFILWVPRDTSRDSILTANIWPFTHDAIRVQSARFESGYFEKVYEDDAFVVIVDLLSSRSLSRTVHEPSPAQYSKPKPLGIEVSR